MLALCLTLPSPKERVLKKSEVKVLSFGEDLGEAKRKLNSNRNLLIFIMVLRQF
jgi:hypothetical protein